MKTVMPWKYSAGKSGKRRDVAIMKEDFPWRMHGKFRDLSKNGKGD